MKLRFMIDTNGNKRLLATFPNAKGFSVQTNQNLPTTHRYSNESLFHDKSVQVLASVELRDYVRLYGTQRQQRLLEVFK